MCHFYADDLAEREEELRRKAAELLKQADALREQRVAAAEEAEQMRRRLREAAFV